MISALQYPSIEPDEVWLRSILLFYDRIYSLSDSRDRWSDDLKRLSDELGEAFLPVPNPYADKREEVARLLVPLLRSIENQATSFTVSFGAYGPTVLGFTPIPCEKFTDELVSLLSDLNLVAPPGLSDVINEVSYGGSCLFIRNKVADTFLSILAQSYADDLNIGSITDGPEHYACASLVDYGKPNQREVRSLLASITVNLIPSEVGLISTKDYAEIRNRYKDLRESIHKLFRDLVELEIDPFNDREDALNKVKEAANQIVMDVDKLSSDRKFSNLWQKKKPITILGLLTMASAVAGDAFNVEIVKDISIELPTLLAGMGITFAPLLNWNLADDIHEPARIKRRLASLAKDVHMASAVRKEMDRLVPYMI